ncbi:GNAT family N-acetyltransferase [Roseomonas sp. OT10]|uniref:GNAT family N-acetyltransferase n=1 Tax=Roseomonas cutis TaxID=2897332 RepID=UPI001E4B0C44|nr:GNAT family N-acetyltransferase [Roseomonas sp. OT10]UFN49168.1 GNAT family N-acetyltransferase [Roseomonas sp. OT10]
MSDPVRDIATLLRLEQAALTAVPAPRVAWDGPFVIRGFHGGTGRANAACSLDPSPDPGLAARVERIESDYARWGLSARFRSTPLDPPGLEALLRERGYAEAEGACVMAGPLAGLSLAGRPPVVERLDGPAPDWLAVLATADYQTEARRAEKAEALPMMARPAVWLLRREEGIPAAAAQMVADGPLCGVFDVATDPAHRRRGLSRQVLAEGAAWAAGHGASIAWLQVAPSNTTARALYAALGLTEIYRYRYFVRR